jgi:hypothetical protein
MELEPCFFADSNTSKSVKPVLIFLELFIVEKILFRQVT